MGTLTQIPISSLSTRLTEVSVIKQFGTRSALLIRRVWLVLFEVRPPMFGRASGEGRE